MAFQRKILEKVKCPRCNGDADLRLDKFKPDTEFVPVYLICPICRLEQFEKTTTKKAVRLDTKIRKLEQKLATLPSKAPLSYSLRKKIANLRQEMRKAEIFGGK